MATDTSSRAAAGNCQTESPVRADIALSPGAEQLATAIDIVGPKHLRKIRKPAAASVSVWPSQRPLFDVSPTGFEPVLPP